jgi:chromosome partitioning protein
MGVVPTFYDVRNRISHEVVRTLRRYFTDKVLPPIRINTRLKEAPSKQKTIFEYAPRSAGAQDYGLLVSKVIDALERSPHSTSRATTPAFHLDGT